MAPGGNKENQMNHNKSTPSMHEPDGKELLSLQAGWIYGFWVSDLTLDTCTVVHCHGIYSPLLQPWIGTAVLTQITGKHDIGTQTCPAETLLDLKVTYSLLEMP